MKPTVEPLIPPVAVEIPNGSTVFIWAAYPDAPPEPSDPFYLPAPVGVFAPCPMPTSRGDAALTFTTRERAITEGPRRRSLSDTVSLATGRHHNESMPYGMTGIDAPAWEVKIPQGSIPASVLVGCSFPFSSASLQADLDIEYCREDGRTGALLMSTETLAENQAAISDAFHAFVAANPGLANILECGLGTMDARIMRFEADRLDRLKDNAKALKAEIAAGTQRIEGETVEELRDNIATQASHLREGAEVIEENLAPFDSPGGYVR